ncbi:Golgi Dsc E3 ligase complex subunit Dsc4 [Schizosaccharomyces osmophilus]|uniref:Golgi Dsc E3 ligase complex subunit Dsc4 n=1 Tax=Schizosaccharomyces osmophilus TaxID=2545709 RepID=A0AAE9WBY4_9SCHI|nr:Golgi Dsc E3 ligase complex subunit Dsc4 [Schizosaccharomyces osmophilus]WBW73015.1 Golgi Dsc E3 ligase complex subunit Dsc4 [Schizosaccharomyces osmophilus]
MNTIVLDHRGEFLSFFRCLDMLCYAIIIQQYYQDPVIFLLLFKIFVQLSYLTPKPFLQFSSFPLFYPLLISFAISLFSRFLFSLPIPGESLDGYLYGGSIINFIGEKAVSSYSSLILSDFFLFLLQIFMALALVSVNQKDLRAFLNRNSDGTDRPPLGQAPSVERDSDRNEQQSLDDGQRHTLLRNQTEVERQQLFTRFSQSIRSLRNGMSAYPFANSIPLARSSAGCSIVPTIEIKKSDWKHLFWKVDPLSEFSSLNASQGNDSAHLASFPSASNS